MELRIVIFLGLVSAATILNTAVIVGVYRMFTKLSLRMTETMSDLRPSEMREWINSLQVSAERAAAVTESTKAKFAENDVMFERAQEKYRQTLVTLDQKLGGAAEKITTTALNVRNIIAKPAFTVASFTAGIGKVIEGGGGKEDEEGEGEE
jgi:hypothetical protein